jgi:hypothetical protein
MYFKQHTAQYLKKKSWILRSVYVEMDPRNKVDQFPHSIN